MTTRIITVLSFFILILFLIGCTRQKEKELPINLDDLPGIYVDSILGSDSIIIHADKTYTHINYEYNGSRNCQKGTWKFKEGYLFLEEFGRYDYKDSISSVHKTGSWAPKVITDKSGQLRLKYSNRIYYGKIDLK